MLFPHSLVAVREQHYFGSFSDLNHEPEGWLRVGPTAVVCTHGSGQLPMWERRDWTGATESGVRLDMAFLLTER
jgi:hypothetical protein